MAIPHSLYEISMAISRDVMHVYIGWRAMNELVANLHEVIQDPIMQEKTNNQIYCMSLLWHGRKRCGVASL